eukprot:757745-Hanusia_phi.AAC.2
MVEGSCKIIGHSKKGCTGLCNLSKVLSPRRYKQLFPNETERELYYSTAIKTMENVSGARSVLDGLDKVKRMRYLKLRNASSAANLSQTLNSTWDHYASGDRFKDLMHTSKTGTRFDIGLGIFKWQRRKTYDQLLRMLCDDGDEFLNLTQISRTWSQEDTIFVPRSCSHEVRGHNRSLTILWGRWQLRKESFGSMSGLTLISEAPAQTYFTLEVWGSWSFKQCKLRSAFGGVVQSNFAAKVGFEDCDVSGDGKHSRQAQRLLRARANSSMSLSNCELHHAGKHAVTAAISIWDGATCLLERSNVHSVEVAVQLLDAGSIDIVSSKFGPCAAAVFVYGLLPSEELIEVPKMILDATGELEYLMEDCDAGKMAEAAIPDVGSLSDEVIGCQYDGPDPHNCSEHMGEDPAWDKEK